MNLDETAELFALDSVFSYHPDGATIGDLAEVANACTDFFSHDEWQLCSDYEEYAYISASAVIDLVTDQAESFKCYYQMVTK